MAGDPTAPVEKLDDITEAIKAITKELVTDIPAAVERVLAKG